jgi:hypothetical protein
MFGFCDEEVKLLGPVQAYVALATVLDVKFSVLPAQMGLLLPAVGAAGVGFTVTETVPLVLVQPLTVTLTEYVPDSAVVAFGMEGFCVEEVNPFGPVHE